MSLLHKVSDFYFLGTGSSNGIPNIECLLDPRGCCGQCLEALKEKSSERCRRNTHIALRVKTGENLNLSIIFGCSVNFYSECVCYFPPFQFNQLDGVFIMGDDYESIFGLDDLRAWTIGGCIQPFVDVYLTQTAYNIVERVFPYMIDKSLATGGG
eukprot:Sdes_comp22340_c0_seq1m20823